VILPLEAPSTLDAGNAVNARERLNAVSRKIIEILLAALTWIDGW